MSHILVVEDNIIIQRMVSHIISRLGHDVDTAINGLEALDKMSSQEYDLVITDAKMPKMDGVALIKRIRSISAFASLPVVLMTAQLDVYKEISPEQLSMATLLTKPISSQELTQVLHELLPLEASETVFI